MSKIFAVFGATGQQGGSVVDFVLNDATLSGHYNVRAITRDPAKPAAQALQQKGVELAKADLADTASIEAALSGVDTIFSVTNTFEGLTKAKETEQGIRVANAAVLRGAKYIIWSSAPSPAAITENLLPNIHHFESKADVESHIRTLPIQSSFYVPAVFMQNFQNVLRPRPLAETNGTYAIPSVLNPTTKVPMIDIVGDSGKFVGAVLSEPERLKGAFLAAAHTRLYSFEEVAAFTSQQAGKKVVYKQLSDDECRKVMPPDNAAQLTEMLVFFREYGFFGPDTEKVVAWTAQQAKGQLTSFEEYLRRDPITLS